MTGQVECKSVVRSNANGWSSGVQLAHSLHNASFVVMDGVPGRCIAGYVFTMPDGDTTSKHNPSTRSGKTKASFRLKTRLAAHTRLPNLTTTTPRVRSGVWVRRFFAVFYTLVEVASMCKQISRISRASARA